MRNMRKEKVINKNTSMQKKLSEIAEMLKGKLIGDGSIVITGASGIKEAKPGDITFLANLKYANLIGSTMASAVIISKDINIPLNIPAIIVENADLAFAKVIEIFALQPIRPNKGIHPTSVIGKDIILGKDISIGAFAVIEEGTSIGDRTIIYPNSYIGHYVKIGSDCLIYPRVVLRERVEIGNKVTIHSGAVIGSDGFGYAMLGGEYHKIPQTGTVLIEDDVSIGANVTIDRARFDKTIIKKGTKIDNLVHIAHNVEIGENSVIAAQCGIAGSTKLGKNAMLGGQVGIIGHINIGDNVMIAAQSGVPKDIPSGAVFSGSPAKPHSQTLREWAILKKLPELANTIKELKEQIGELKERISNLEKVAKNY